MITRRDFVKNSLFGSAGIIATSVSTPQGSQNNTEILEVCPSLRLEELYSPLLDLTPAKWIWYPSERTLQNSVFLFRKTFHLGVVSSSAKGWVLADSRYKLYVNGKYVQFGPAPFDPRQPEADPVDISPYIHEGENVITAEVLYYGIGEGTWPIGKPGFILNIALDGKESLISDDSWMVSLGESWKPGQHKRWYLRAFQEEFDSRKYPYGWKEQGYHTDNHWLKAMVIDLPADKPPIASPYDEYQQEIRANPDHCSIRRRSIPLMKEVEVTDCTLLDSFGVVWKSDPARYFEFVTPGLYEESSLDDFREVANGTYSVGIHPPNAAVLTFEFKEQIVGFPYFTIEAAEGTIVEMMFQEGHEPDNFLMNNRLHSWTRFICREGRNEFVTFDYESLRFIQFHIHGQPGRVTISNIGVRRRISGWDALPNIETSDAQVNQVLSATINTLFNSAQDLMVDCMGRERQQYSGDVGHQIHSLFSAFGDWNLPNRYVNTFSQGITLEGFFMDSWPAYDRLARIPQKQMGLTMWGPIIDHGVGFVFDCYYSYQYSGNIGTLHEVYPKLIRFYNYLLTLQGEQELQPVENTGLTWVWMDSDCYSQQRHKQCSFNLYCAAMMMKALAPLARAVGDSENAKEIETQGEKLLNNTIKRFWHSQRGLFVDNLPWVEEEGSIRLSDRTLAMALVYDLIPERKSEPTIRVLEVPPSYMGLSFPANSIWRLWALGLAGKSDAIIHEIKTRWYQMDSVKLNNSLQEHWSIQPDTRGQWSHCAIGPLFVTYNYLAGIHYGETGLNKILIKPNPGSLEALNLDYHTPEGIVEFRCRGKKGSRSLSICLPNSLEGILLLDKREKINLQETAEFSDQSHNAYPLVEAGNFSFELFFT